MDLTSTMPTDTVTSVANELAKFLIGSMQSMHARGNLRRQKEASILMVVRNSNIKKTMPKRSTRTEAYATE